MTFPFNGASQAAIIWPLKYQPGTTDNFISNELIVKDVTAAQVWTVLSDLTTHRPTSKGFVSSSRPSPDLSTHLSKGNVFFMRSEGFTNSYAVKECVAPERLAWCTYDQWDQESEEDVYHAWLIESLAGGRVRILSQQSILYAYADDSERKDTRNRRLIGYQDWLEGIVVAARLIEVKGSGGFRPDRNSLFQQSA